MKSVIAVASGKGGVGKSTVAANLAVSLANDPLTPRKVALIDIDFYGPTIPVLMGGGEIAVDAEGRFLPALRYNVKYISIAFFLKNPDDAVVWRGPMFGKGITQLFHDVNWGEVDTCIVDLPPGTGDAQLSISQVVQLDGVVMVTTPQEVSLSDVRRAINMFRKVNVNVLGVIENMSGFVTPGGERFDIFGSGGGAALAKQYELPLLASIPIDMAIREGGDAGKPVVLSEGSEAAKIYRLLGSEVVRLAAEGRAQAPGLSISN